VLFSRPKMKVFAIDADGRLGVVAIRNWVGDMSSLGLIDATRRARVPRAAEWI
jgi:hypothetical protein